MSSRFLITGLCIGAVAFACGPRARSEASATTQQSVSSAGDVATVTQQATPRLATTTSAKKSAIVAQMYVRRNENRISFALHVINTSKKRVEITFPSGQTYDFVVLDSVGREVWRWGTNRMFTQAVRNKLLGSGETLEFEESLKSAPLAPGRYVARATLTSANYPLAQETEFTVTATAIASR